MKILPINSDGEPVGVLLLDASGSLRILLIQCGDEQHKLSLTINKDLKIHNHSEKEIEDELTMAKLAQSADGACPCVRVKMWLQDGIYILEIIP